MIIICGRTKKTKDKFTFLKTGETFTCESSYDSLYFALNLNDFQFLHLKDK